MYMFLVLTHLLTDVMAVVNCMNLTFQQEDVNMSSIQVVQNVTLESLDDFMNEPGEAERKFIDALQVSKCCDFTLTQADTHTFRVLCTEYIAKVTKSINKKIPLGASGHHR